MDLTIIQKIAVSVIPILFAISLHEVAHGWVASWFGDHTARLSGRLTLNPFNHIDLIGTILVPLLMLMVSNFIFGWAKPVPVDARNMRNPRWDMAVVALAGPLANLVMAFIWGCIGKLGFLLIDQFYWLGNPLIYMGSIGMMINIVFAVLNLLPFPPLDGGKIMSSLLPPRISYYLRGLEPYSFLILVVLAFSGILQHIMGPPIMFLIKLFSHIFNF